MILREDVQPQEEEGVRHVGCHHRTRLHGGRVQLLAPLHRAEGPLAVILSGGMPCAPMRWDDKRHPISSQSMQRPPPLRPRSAAYPPAVTSKVSTGASQLLYQSRPRIVARAADTPCHPTPCSVKCSVDLRCELASRSKQLGRSMAPRAAGASNNSKSLRRRRRVWQRGGACAVRIQPRGTSLIRNCAPLGPYSRTMPSALW